MAPRICTSCDLPHITTDWYVINEHRHPHRGDLECADAHENRIRRETRLVIFSAPKLVFDDDA